MIEKDILDYLIDNGFEAYMERPEKAKKPFVLISKTGGGIDDHIERATIVVQSYANSLYQSAVLNERVRNALISMPDLANMSRVKLNSDYNYTDTTTKEYRYQAVYDVVK